jgi:hypothetical protein
MTSMIDEGDFGYPVRIAENFDDVLARSGPSFALNKLSSLVQQKGQMLLQARGGAGKTVTARRIADLEPNSHGVAFVSALRLPAAPVDISTALDIEVLIPLSVDPERANMLRDRAEGLVVIDGINEIPKGRADEILMAIPGMAARYPFIRFLLTDRLSRRDIDQTAWVLATLGPVPERKARALSGYETGLLPDHLTIPYYLDRSTRQDGAASQVDILRGGITTYGGVPESGLNSLARSVYASYQDRCDRAIDSQQIREAVGDDVFHEMLKSGLLLQENGIQFAHHLTQDFLAALHLSADDELWNPTGFDTVTLKASSFDALALAAALVGAEHVDDFVHRVFDWNYYGAAYLLEEDQAGEKRIWEAMRTAILAMLAEKRFDRMIVTAHRVEDALRLQDVELAGLLLAANDRDAVVDVVEAALPENWDTTWPKWFHDWYETFKRPSGTDASLNDVDGIESTIGTVGWATSNMLKRLNTSEDLCRIVGDFATGHRNSTVRWRAVHALGAWPTNEVIEVLLDRVRDPNEVLWVRYGALRSVLEAAAGGPKRIRRRVFNVLGSPEVAGLVVVEPQLRKEAIRALEVSEMPDDWHARAGDFLEYLWTKSDDPLERDEVLLLAQRLRNARAVDA